MADVRHMKARFSRGVEDIVCPGRRFIDLGDLTVDMGVIVMVERTSDGYVLYMTDGRYNCVRQPKVSYEELVRALKDYHDEEPDRDEPIILAHGEDRASAMEAFGLILKHLASYDPEKLNGWFMTTTHHAAFAWPETIARLLDAMYAPFGLVFSYEIAGDAMRFRCRKAK